MVDRSVEIGVVGDLARQQQFRICDRQEILVRARRKFRQVLADTLPQARANRPRHGEDSCQRRDLKSFGHIEHHFTDRHAGPFAFLPAPAECREWQILYRKIGFRPVRRFHPAAKCRIVRCVNHSSHPNSRKSSSGSSKEHDPKLCAKSQRASAICSAVRLAPRQRSSSPLKSNVAGFVSLSKSRIKSRFSPCQANAAAVNTLTNPCITPRGLSAA